ncbi:hypothetical protein [Ruegeria arenilitoris]|uniref:hypothetical protein n=1 Tax=Ruegeria arenilitoris TaxID=1173585 RepID=UPI0020C2508A|nr:hypothetical protein [Ruegeria arenilitoris]
MPHRLRSGFLNQVALDGAPIQTAMRQSLRRSVAQAQAQKYYDDVDTAENLATDLLGRHGKKETPGFDPALPCPRIQV